MGHRRLWLAGLLLLLAVALPLPAAALAPATQVTIAARLQPDGSIDVTDRRRLSDTQPVETLEFLLPSGASIELTLADGAGNFANVPANQPLTQPHSVKVTRSDPVVTVQWRPGSLGPQEFTLTYRLRQALVIHRDAIEWYWPAIAGTGGRPVSRVDATIQWPGQGPAYLYAYGGDAGGVRVGQGSLQLAAERIAADRPLEWRLLAPRSSLPDAQGSSGGYDLASLRRLEDQRVSAQMNKAIRLFLQHWLLLLSPLLLGALYWFTVRRLPPEPPPSALSAADLMAQPPAVVGWVYDGSWFDYACAQLMALERKGLIQWEWPDGDRPGAHTVADLRLWRVRGTSLDRGDSALIDLLHLSWDKTPLSAIAREWRNDLPDKLQRQNKWLHEVGEGVPDEWLQRPAPWWGALVAALYLIAGIGDSPLEWLSLWAMAGIAVLMIWKRRWLTPLGESHVARWVQAYWAAHGRSWRGQPVDLPAVLPEYLLAVEVGDDALEQQMGSERYAVVRAVYEHLESLALTKRSWSEDA